MTATRLANPKKVTITLDASDYARFQELYPMVGAAAIIRKLMASHIAMHERAMADAKDISV